MYKVGGRYWGCKIWLRRNLLRRVFLRQTCLRQIFLEPSPASSACTCYCFVGELISSILVFRTWLIRISIYPGSESGRRTNEFKKRAPSILPEMPDRRLLTLENTVLWQLVLQILRPGPRIVSFLNLVNALYLLSRTVISFYLHHINTFVLSGLFHFPDRFQHHPVRENKGRVHFIRNNKLGLFYLPYLSSIHEKANCIAILWTVSPHSLGSCLFRGFYGPPVFHIKVGRPVKCLAQGHNKRTCRLVLHNLPEMPSAKQGSCGYHFLKSFGMTRQGKWTPGLPTTKRTL